MDEATANVRDWIAAHIGPVVHIERQPRWRPAWFAVARRDGASLSLYVRGAREGLGNTLSIAGEAQLFRTLEAHGLPVPHVHGLIDQPEAMVMDRLPGRHNLATADSDADRRSVMDAYMGALARIHAIDPAEFAAAGLSPPPATPEGALIFIERFACRYRAGRRRPEPLMEFGLRWLRRNLPPDPVQPRCVVGDPAQFMFDGGRMTGILDLELAFLGDPAHDLAGCRLRDYAEPLGDVGAALRRYAAATGQPLDAGKLNFYTAQFALGTPLSLVETLHAAPPRPELLQYQEWFHQYSLAAIEAMAEVAGVTLADPALPDPAPHRHQLIAEALPATVETLAGADDVSAFQHRLAANQARYLARAALFSPGIEAANLDELAPVLGYRPADWQAGDTALEAFVLEAGPEEDERLIPLFYRRTMREMLLLEPVLNRTATIRHLPPLKTLLAPRPA